MTPAPRCIVGLVTAVDLAGAILAFNDNDDVWRWPTSTLADRLRLDAKRFLLEFQAPHVCRLDPIVTGDRRTDHRPRLSDLVRALEVQGAARVVQLPGRWPSAELDGLESACPRLTVQIGVDLEYPEQTALLRAGGRIDATALPGAVVSNVTVTRRDPRPEHDAAAAACLIEQVRAMLDPPPAKGLPAVPEALTRHPFDAQVPNTIVLRVRTWLDIAALQAQLGGVEATLHGRPCRRFGPVHVLAYPLAPPYERWLDRLQFTL